MLFLYYLFGGKEEVDIIKSKIFYQLFKPIRNKLKYYSKEKIFTECMKQLINTWNKSSIEISKDKQPLSWFTLLIMKWGLVYGEESLFAKKQFGTNEFKLLYNKLSELPIPDKLSDPKDELSIWKVYRAFCSGQNQYMESDFFKVVYGLSIIEIILKDIKIDYDTNNKMLEILNLCLEDFITYQLLILASSSILIENEKSFFSVDYFNKLFNKYPKNEIQLFLNFISLDFSELVLFFKTHHKLVNNPGFEFTLPSPLNKKPLFRNNGEYHFYHLSILQQHIEFGVYDILKENDHENFSSSFGHGFEEYVTYPLLSISANFKREGDLKRLLGKKNNVIDFLVSESEGTLFIEVKSAEMHPSTLHDPQLCNLERTLQNSLVPGYKQIFKVASKLRSALYDCLFSSDNFYGIIITYKDLMLGSPNSIWDEFMETIMKEKLSDSIMSNLPINPSHIFCLSIYEFDILCEFAKKKKLGLTSCLQIVINNINKPESANNTFLSHFDIEGLNFGNHVQTKFDDIMKRIEEASKDLED